MVYQLRADNFTPRHRTPWGGHKILTRYKNELHLDWPESHVGESWEISVEPSFPSILLESNQTLAQAIASDPMGWLGMDVAQRYGDQTPLLVKLLDAADNLSVQVHPTHDDPALGIGESGKPEGWLILEAEPNGGIYLGFQEGVEPQDVRACIACEGPLHHLMNFVPVKSGDCFYIDAGTAHAIGAGVTLIEPQFVTPNRRGLTYRFWDWNRRYDETGTPSKTGQPRPLHVERSMQVTSWNGPQGDDFVNDCRRSGTRLNSGPSLHHSRWIENQFFWVEDIAGNGSIALAAVDTMRTVTCVSGRCVLSTDHGSTAIECGQSAVVRADEGPLRVDASAARLILCHSPV
jgi:mannose-6-phosphate isomerase class I